MDPRTFLSEVGIVDADLAALLDAGAAPIDQNMSRR